MHARVRHGRFLHFEADPHDSEFGLRIGSHVDRVRPCHGPGSPLKTKRFNLETTPRGFAYIAGAVHRVRRRDGCQ